MPGKKKRKKDPHRSALDKVSNSTLCTSLLRLLSGATSRRFTNCKKKKVFMRQTSCPGLMSSTAGRSDIPAIMQLNRAYMLFCFPFTGNEGQVGSTDLQQLRQQGSTICWRARLGWVRQLQWHGSICCHGWPVRTPARCQKGPLRYRGIFFLWLGEIVSTTQTLEKEKNMLMSSKKKYFPPRWLNIILYSLTRGQQKMTLEQFLEISVVQLILDINKSNLILSRVKKYPSLLQFSVLTQSLR